MLPNEILPAITRQKLKNKTTGLICDMIYQDHAFGFSVFVMGEDGKMRGWHLDDCEPVPEEPRPFRCGSKVFAKYTSEFGTIQKVRAPINGWPEGYSIDGDYFYSPEAIRFATPSECVQYFN